MSELTPGTLPDPGAESEWEEQELLVYAEMEETLDISTCHSAHVLGIDTSRPLLQLDDNFFQGKFVPALGTYMFFELDENPESTDPLFDPLPEQNLKYVCKSDKVMLFNRVYLTPKEGQEYNLPEKIIPPEEKVEMVEFSTLEEALQKFESAHKESKTKIESQMDLSVTSPT